MGAEWRARDAAAYPALTLPSNPMPDGWPIVQRGLLMAYVGPVCFVCLRDTLDEEGERLHEQELMRAIDLRGDDVRVGVVYDALHSRGVSAIARSDLARKLNERRAHLRRTTAAYALCTSSALVRGMLQAVFWIAPPPYPHTTVDTLDAAVEFVARQLTGVDAKGTLEVYRGLLERHRRAIDARA